MEVSWSDIRGVSWQYNWPRVKTVDPNTFVGKIRAKTGLAFDLPTEAQWEYACRAGTDSNFGNGGDGDNDSRLMGHAFSDVGLYVPNFWGFYDMHGNIGQWCLDYYSDGYTSDPAVDYVGAESGSDRLVRSWYDSYYPSTTSFSRKGVAHASYGYYYGYPHVGFRLSRTLVE